MDDSDEKIEEIYFMIRDNEKGLSITNKKTKFKHCKNCFHGNEFVQWIINNLNMPKFIAEQIGQNFMDKLIIHRCQEDEYNKDDERIFTSDSSLYRFQADEDSFLLNCKQIFSGYIRSPGDIIQDLKRNLTNLYKKYILENENINYEIIYKSIEYRKFINLVVELQMINPHSFKNQREIAPFFVNIYNILVFHISLEKEKPQNKYNLFKRKKQDSKYGYMIGGEKYTLSDIEYLIFQMIPKQNLNTRKQTVATKNEKKKMFTISNIDPRIHFLLNNNITEDSGFDKLNPFHFYGIDNFCHSLQIATEKYCNSNEIKINLFSKSICLPWVFDEFRFDFGKDIYEMLKWISNFLIDQKKKDFQSLLDDIQTQIVFEIIDENKPKKETIHHNMLVSNEKFSFIVLHKNYALEMDKKKVILIVDVDSSLLNYKGNKECISHSLSWEYTSPQEKENFSETSLKKTVKISEIRSKSLDILPIIEKNNCNKETNTNSFMVNELTKNYQENISNNNQNNKELKINNLKIIKENKAINNQKSTEHNTFRSFFKKKTKPITNNTSYKTSLSQRIKSFSEMNFTNTN